MVPLIATVTVVALVLALALVAYVRRRRAHEKANQELTTSLASGSTAVLWRSSGRNGPGTLTPNPVYNVGAGPVYATGPGMAAANNAAGATYQALDADGMTSATKAMLGGSGGGGGQGTSAAYDQLQQRGPEHAMPAYEDPDDHGQPQYDISANDSSISSPNTYSMPLAEDQHAAWHDYAEPLAEDQHDYAEPLAENTPQYHLALAPTAGQSGSVPHYSTPSAVAGASTGGGLARKQSVYSGFGSGPSADRPASSDA